MLIISAYSNFTAYPIVHLDVIQYLVFGRTRVILVPGGWLPGI